MTIKAPFQTGNVVCLPGCGGTTVSAALAAALGMRVVSFNGWEREDLRAQHQEHPEIGVIYDASCCLFSPEGAAQILLTCDPDVQIDRMRGRDGVIFPAAVGPMLRREGSHAHLFRDKYMIDAAVFGPDHPKRTEHCFSAVVDTTYLTAEQSARQALDQLQQKAVA